MTSSTGVGSVCSKCGGDCTLTNIYRDDVWGALTLVEYTATCGDCGQVERYSYGEYEILKGGE